MDDEGRAVFDQLQEGPRTKPEAILFAFDLIELNGEDLRREPLLTRKSTLLNLLKGKPAGIVYNEHMEGDGPMIFRHACRLGVRDLLQAGGCAEPIGGSRDWIKTKAPTRGRGVHRGGPAACLECRAEARGENSNKRSRSDPQPEAVRESHDHLPRHLRLTLLRQFDEQRPGKIVGRRAVNLCGFLALRRSYLHHLFLGNVGI